MEEIVRRVGALETDMKDVKAILGRLEPVLARMDKRLESVESAVHKGAVEAAESKGRLASLPTTFQVVTWFIAVAVALTGLTFTIARAMHG